MAVRSGVLIPVVCASPADIGTSATIVPTLVPIDRLIKHVARKRPGKTILSGSIDNIRCTVASTAPIIFAALAKAPARIKIHNINMIL